MDCYLADVYPNFNNYKVVMPVFGAMPNPFTSNYTMRPDGTLSDETDPSANDYLKAAGAGAASGAATGAVVGAAVGSVVPVLGTVVGGTAGGAIGTVVGGGISAYDTYLTGDKKRKEAQEKERQIAAETDRNKQAALQAAWDKSPENPRNPASPYYLKDGQIITYGFGDQRKIRRVGDQVFYEMYYDPAIKWRTLKSGLKVPAFEEYGKEGGGGVINTVTGQKDVLQPYQVPEQKTAEIKTDNSKMYMILGAAAIGLFLLTKKK